MDKAACYLLVLVLAMMPSTNAPARDKPNMVVIFIDDMGYGDIGPFGNTINQTPNLDRMAAEGNVLRDFYVSSVACTPSRAALMTGSYAHKIGMDGMVYFPVSPNGLNPEETTIPEVLERGGYVSGCFGKWHLGDQREFLPLQQGFDEFFGIPYSCDMWQKNTHVRNKNTGLPYPPLPIMKGNTPVAYVSDEIDQSLLCEVVTDKAVEFIERNRRKPFFLFLSHSYVHWPRYARPEIYAAAEGSPERAQIQEVDTSVGRILDKLRELGLHRRTLVLFTSDNGAATGLSSGPLRGNKKEHVKYEGTMRVPTITWWPGIIRPGTETTKIAETIDLLPTFAFLAGVSPPGEDVIDGKNCIGILIGDPDAESPRRERYFEKGAVRQGRWKYIPNREGELYDLEVDLGESNNLAAQYPERVEEMSALLEQHNQRIKDAERPSGTVENPRAILEEPGDVPSLARYTGYVRTWPYWKATPLESAKNVSTAGRLLEALNFNGGKDGRDHDCVINGVKFEGFVNADARSSDFPNPSATYFSSNSGGVVSEKKDVYEVPPGIAEYDRLLSGMLVEGTPKEAFGNQVALKRLKPGAIYELQLFFGAGNHHIVIDGGLDKGLVSAFGSPEETMPGTSGMVLTGKFKASSEMLSFTIGKGKGARVDDSLQLCAYQLRALSSD